MYIVHRDRTGRWFVDLLAERARAGVSVRLLYDWFGCGLGPALGLFRPLSAAGGDVRACNPPKLHVALGWLRRNHRKMIAVDGRVAFVSGLCLGDMWIGDASRDIEPWRDTGVEIRGPAVAHAERAFADNWERAGGSRPEGIDADEAAPVGTVNLRLVPSEPFTAQMLRLDLLVAAAARRTLWIADAYFLGHGPFVSALREAAVDGVDVRLLLPRGSDVGWTVPLSRTLYRSLLEAGVRIFEWRGTMMHAKTAVADGRWARIGSTNLNINSWMGNWELDVAIEDDRIARTLEGHYEADLARSTEIVLAAPGGRRPRRRPSVEGRTRRSARRALRAVTGWSHAVGAAVSGNRELESWESAPVLTLGLVMALVAAAGVLWPASLAWPLSVVFGAGGVSLLTTAVGLRRPRRERNGT
jgi:phosphatidylserine/phosphatidylglycerophosphate/cardiolipin synthase-like enzyme